MMSINNTINLVFKATLMARGGENFILKMPVVKLKDLADIVIEEYANKYGYKKTNIKKKIIGSRPGEKMYEELMTETEAKRAFETKDMLILLPQVDIGINPKASDYKNAKISKLKRYISRDIKPLSKEGVRKLLFS